MPHNDNVSHARGLLQEAFIIMDEETDNTQCMGVSARFNPRLYNELTALRQVLNGADTALADFQDEA